jgi:hypothetical protein
MIINWIKIYPIKNSFFLKIVALQLWDLRRSDGSPVAMSMARE